MWADFIFGIIFLPTGPIICGQGLPNDLQMYNYVQMLSNTSKLSLNSSSSSEALKNVMGYPAPDHSHVASLDRINPVLPKKESSKVSFMKSTVCLIKVGLACMCVTRMCWSFVVPKPLVFYCACFVLCSAL